jgi:DNA-binding IclR family transcriptional regulator
VLGLLQREEGATLAELVAATGWQPHTTRAALTGLRHKGHLIEKWQRDGATTYRIRTAL